jgi:hypothetical protein
MTFKSIAFPFTFGSILLTIAIAFVFHEFTKILLMVVRPINFSFTLHIEVNLRQRSSTNQSLVMIL